MTGVIALLVFQTLIPLLLLWWSVLPGPGSRIEWIAKVVMIGAYLVAAWLVGNWLVPSIYAPYAYFVIYLVYLPIAWIFVRRRAWRPAARIGRMRVVAFAAAATVFTAIAAVAAFGSRPSTEAQVELEFPLRDGTFYVAGGGPGPLIGARLSGGNAQQRASREPYALDIVAVDHLGQRSKGLLPARPDRYVSFGKAVVAPCDGVVEQARDGLPDLDPPKGDAANPAGNHILLSCGPVQVLLAHLRSGSIPVKAGDVVKRGDVIGQVGNSGDSREPHLHVHAVRQGASVQDGPVVPMGFGGRVLVHGDRIER